VFGEVWADCGNVVFGDVFTVVDDALAAEEGPLEKTVQRLALVGSALNGGPQFSV